MAHPDISPVEQRRQSRLEIQDELPVTNLHSGQLLGQLVNLSMEGFMIASPAALETGTTYQLNIPLSAEGVDDASLIVGAESLWSDDNNGSGSFWTGFYIIDISPEYQTILEQLVSD
ncbi:MAG: PilZ domain-containing protein [Gammaproteobacteria bacterium]